MPTSFPPDSDKTSWTTSSGTIRKGMRVITPDGDVLGTVRTIEGDEILLDFSISDETRGFVMISQVDGVNEDSVLLSPRGDATFGLGAQP